LKNDVEIAYQKSIDQNEAFLLTHYKVVGLSNDGVICILRLFPSDLGKILGLVNKYKQ
jgi:hypothetical protein